MRLLAVPDSRRSANDDVTGREGVEDCLLFVLGRDARVQHEADTLHLAVAGERGDLEVFVNGNFDIV